MSIGTGNRRATALGVIGNEQGDGAGVQLAAQPTGDEPLHRGHRPEARPIRIEIPVVNRESHS